MLFVKYWNISNFEFTMNGYRHKFAVTYVFLEQDLNSFHAKFQVYGTSSSIFLPKNAKICQFSL